MSGGLAKTISVAARTAVSLVRPASCRAISTRLAADEALALYPFRWSVERMYFDLKTVLNLNRAYAANPNAVAMEHGVYL
jgi:hypothetical protein